MEFLRNSAQMKECDRYTIEEIGIPSVVLMERAALAVVEEIERAGYDLSDTLVLCGSGNNGGDGFAVARLLAERCGQLASERAERPHVTLVFTGRESSITEETARQRKICEACGLKTSSNFMEHAYTVIVDAMLGIGLSRDIEGRYAGIIGWINAQRGRTKIVAVDMPSGVSADSGHVLGTAVSADLTVTFAARKPGQLLYPGAEYCGRLICRPIGVVCRQPRADRPCPQTGERESFCAEDVAFTCTDLDLARIAPRRASSNKGSYGKILLIAGSCGMSGAACLAARAAYRSGSGMVRVFTPECNRTVIQTALPEALVTSWEPGEAAEEKERAAFEWSDAAGIGPGLGQSGEARRLLWLALAEYEKPLVLDADALNLLAGSSEFLRKARAPVIVTPHIGEMARLCGSPKEEIKADPQGIAKRFAAAYHVICVLKDARTVVSDGQRVYINTSGNHGMATAGSGDVLTGVILGLLGQGMGAFEAAVLGVYLHGRAGDLAREKEGAYGLMAGDLPEQVAQVLKIAERMNAGEQKAAEWRKR